MVWPMVLATVASGVLSYVGGQQAAKERARANSEAARLQQQMMDRIMAMGYPSEEAIKMAQEKYPIDWSVYDQDSLNKIKLQDTELKGLIDSPEFKVQQGALDKYGEISAEKGMDAQARAAYEQATMESAQQARAQQEALKQTMAMRGIGGSGIELALAQKAGQGASNVARMAGTQQAAEAQKRALQALADQTNLAEKMIGTRKDIGLQQDTINKFNTGELLKTQRDLNEAKLADEAAKKNVLRNYPVAQSEFEMSKLSPLQSSVSNVASGIQKQGDIQATKTAGGYEAGSKVLSSFGNYMNKNKKKDEEEEE